MCIFVHILTILTPCYAFQVEFSSFISITLKECGGCSMLVKDKISIERKKKGISTTQLAAMIGTTQGTVSRYETGSIKIIPVDMLRKIVESLECDFNEFVCDDPKYSLLASVPVDPSTLSDDDRRLLAWFHNLPDGYKLIVRQFWELPAINV